ncbi:MAG: hypothetical protein JSR65_09040 [Proteobacteria bacterium]|nr:hypothetical protein [Pseudomonadota bacterium]
MRLAVWLAILVLALLGRWMHNDAVAAASVPLALGFFFFSTPRRVRAAVWVMAAGEAVAWALGGPPMMLDVLPAAIAGFVGWLFARSLSPARTPLIARAIAAIEGEAALRDTAIVRYARRLTALWAALQFALAGWCALCLLRDHGPFSGSFLPPPRVFGTTLLPLASATLFFGEFFLRPRLLPQAPRHTLTDFLAALGRAWPTLIED